MAPVRARRRANMVAARARRMIELALKSKGRALAARDVDRLFEEFITYCRPYRRPSRPFPG
jgi:hypothetical protein